MTDKRTPITLHVWDVVEHPIHGRGTIDMIYTAMVGQRVWLRCRFGRSGGFHCYADEVVLVEHAKPEVQP